MPKLSSPTPRSVATNDADTLTGKINEIKAMKTPQLKALWQELYFREAPVMHSNLLKMRLIWRVQEIMKGGLSQRASDELTSLRRRLRRGRIAEKTPQESLPLGTRLSREYDGEPHEVLVVREGFEYRGEIYTSLTKVAKVITGTAWSGPAFFGLKKATQKKNNKEENKDGQANRKSSK